MGKNIYCITDFGAAANGRLMTDKIQAAIDTCFLDGGGTVVVPEGEFHTGGIRLRSNITLLLKKGAVLVGSRDPKDYFAIRSDLLEPLSEADMTEVKWSPADVRQNNDHLNKCGSSWNNALIRAIDAHNITIIGEKGSVIDGNDCFDATGEENYRGPHAINMHRCINIRLSGYTIKNSANWAHALFKCRNIDVRDVTVLGGHDGVHLRSSCNAVITGCDFYTGDDCVAGFGNLNISVSDCYLNTACSGMRFGGTNVMAKNCKFIGPAKYIFRGSLSDEEKRSGKTSAVDNNHRYNMLSAYTYAADHSVDIKHYGSILIENCEVKNTDRLVHYNFSGNEPWQCNMPMDRMEFRNISAHGIKMPITMYGTAEKPFKAEFENITVEFDKEAGDISFIHTAWFKEITLKNVKLMNLTGDPVIKTWSPEGELVTDAFDYGNSESKLISAADEPFVCNAI